LGLFENTVQCAWRQIIVEMSGYCDPTRFGRMLVLPVTASRGYQIPPVLFDHLDDITNLHRRLFSPPNSQPSPMIHYNSSTNRQEVPQNLHVPSPLAQAA